MNSVATRIGILGDPTHQVPWTNESVAKLRSIGFNEVQINIGWGSRPYGEAENLADMVTVPGESESPATLQRRAELKRRVQIAKRYGLKTMFNFGSPNMAYNPASGETSQVPYRTDNVTAQSWYDVLNPKVRDHEIALLRELRRQFPEVDDILVYTYDQNAWQTPEFQWNAFSYGVPLSDRLPGYLADLHKVWTEGRLGKARMWWEPWELSAGELYTILPNLPRTDFGLMIHGNIGETQLALPVDVWFRNVARMGRDLGIPVVAEGFFASATEEIEPLTIPAPRLVDQEYLAFVHVPGITGVKEYYGINTIEPDLDVELLQARFSNPSLPTAELTARVTRRFGAAQGDIRAYLDLLSDALETYPWDASDLARAAGRGSPDHGWEGATIRGGFERKVLESIPLDSGFGTLQFGFTPSWESTKRGKFMVAVTVPSDPHFWTREDVELRCKLASDLLARASEVGARLIDELGNPSDKEQFIKIQKDVETLHRVSRSYELHLRETNVAQMLRQDLTAGRPLTPALAKELSQLLDLDVANQNEHGRVVEMRQLYRDRPEAFVRQYLVPMASASLQGERGMFTLTTP